MATATVEQVQQEYIEHAADSVDRWLTNKNIGNRGVGKGERYTTVTNVSEAKLQETKDLAIATARAVGLVDEADKVEKCGKSYSVSKCDKCGEYWGHPYHCNEHICPVCYYRNLFRFMKRHEAAWCTEDRFTLITVDYGHYRQYEVEDGMKYAAHVHKDILKLYPSLRGGIYHIQLLYDSTYREYHILYHYFLNGHQNWTFYIMMALDGRALVTNHKYFDEYRDAERYFVRECCKYPADILLDTYLLQWYLSLMARRKLLQGFGAFYKISGGRERTIKQRERNKCRVCGGNLHYVGIVPKKYVFWDSELRCYCVDPGAPGL